MLPYGPRDLANAFRTVRTNTLEIVKEIPEDKLDFSPAKDSKTIRQMLTHIAFSDEFAIAMHKGQLKSVMDIDFAEMMGRLSAEEQKPRDKASLITLLTERGDAFASFLESLDDSFLAETVAMPPNADPASKTRMEMLMGVKEHEMHHRGQLMLTMRLLGQVPPLTRRRQEQFAAMQAAAQASAR